MTKLCIMTDYSVVCLGRLAQKQRNLMSETGLTFLIVQKLLKLLVSKSDLIWTNRGALGCYIFNRNSSDILVLKSTKAPDGPITLISCVDRSESSCETSNICFLGGKLKKINEIFRKSLNEIFLNDLLSYKNSFLIDDNQKF